MKHDAHFEAATEVPHWSTPLEAREQLDREIDGFVSGAAAATMAPEAALALPVTAGLGKTATALRVIARHGEALLGQGHVLFYVPTLELAERAFAEFQALAEAQAQSSYIMEATESARTSSAASLPGTLRQSLFSSSCLPKFDS